MSWIKKNNNQNKLSNMNLKATMVAIATFLGFDTAKENVLTEEHVEKVNSELSRLTGENTTLAAELVTANTSIKTLGEDKTKLEGEKTQLTTDLNTANTTIKILEQTIKDHESTIASLKQVPGAPAAAVKTASDVTAKNDVLDFVAANIDDTATCLTEMRKNGYKS